uniref:GPI mannosyltransferase 2 n=1 Tax=Trypanosoma congolense (strain IL3000) TaxID=1068625 RepID=G0UY79_TRYCI|nr:unnamed protein product [Trypanosoma congolense IL3000]
MTLSYAQKMDGFQRVAHCSDVKLFFLVSGSRLMILVLMLSFRIVLPMIFGTELLWDSATLLYGDVDGTWGLLDFPRSWDGVHFFHIAKHGYSHENVCAFFPLVPSIIRIFSWVNDNLLPASWVIVPISFQVALLNVVMAGFAAIILRRITIITLMGDIASPSGKGGETVGTWLDSLPPPPAYLQSERVAENLQVRLWKGGGRNGAHVDVESYCCVLGLFSTRKVFFPF